ncbi:MAG: purine-nucleoside phosphorylase, partial [Myxococcaceae bacterium]
MSLFEQLHITVAAIRAKAGDTQPVIGVILGSGLGAFADTFEDKRVLAYSDLPHFPDSSVPGHAGRLVLGRLGTTSIVAMQGRVHAYEGYRP